MAYVNDLTAYIGMLRGGFPDTKLVAVHTMPQRNARRARLYPSSPLLLVRVRQYLNCMGIQRPESRNDETLASVV